MQYIISSSLFKHSPRLLTPPLGANFISYFQIILIRTYPPQTLLSLICVIYGRSDTLLVYYSYEDQQKMITLSILLILSILSVDALQPDPSHLNVDTTSETRRTGLYEGII